MKYFSQFLNYAIGLSLIIVGVFIYFETHKTQIMNEPKQINAEDLTNQYLHEANQKLKNERYKAQIAIREVNQNDQVKGSNTVEQSIQPIPVERQIVKDTYVEDQRQKTVEQKFQEDLRKAQERQLRSESEKIEYIKQFKANARKNGYEIVVDDNLQVISIEPIRKPSNNDVDARALDTQEY